MGRDHKEKKDKKDKKDKKEKREKEKRLREAFNEERAEEEERHARKSQKKIEKVAKLLGYDNDTNPFGDSNLLKPFEWGKKKDKDTAEGRKSKTGSEKEAERMTLIKDIDRVRQRRIEREQEQEEMERLRNEEQRLREAANYGDWQKKEEDFHIDQTRMRSKIRLSENREKPIDTLAKNILLLEEITREECKGSGVFGDGVDMSHLSMELRNPEQVLQTLDNEELSTLSRDVRAYLQLEEKKAKNSSSSSSSSGSSSSGSSEELALQYNGNYSSFWAAMETLVLFEQQKREAVGSVHHNVTEVISTFLHFNISTFLHFYIFTYLYIYISLHLYISPFARGNMR
jgi:hypothetical protein